MNFKGGLCSYQLVTVIGQLRWPTLDSLFFLHHTIHCTVPPVTLIARTHMEKSGSYAYYAICKYRWKYNPVTFAASLSLKVLCTSIQCTAAMSSKECSIGPEVDFWSKYLEHKI